MVIEEPVVEVVTPEALPERIDMVFLCGDGNSTLQKTYLSSDGKNVFFSQNDKISVFDGTYNNAFTAQQYGSTSSSFTGKAADVESYVMMHPYMADNKAIYKDGKIITNMLNKQIAVADSYDPQAAISVATCKKDENFTLKNATTMFKVTPQENFSQIILRAMGGEPIAGMVQIDPADASSSIFMSSEGYSDIVLNPASGEELLANTTYYIHAFPQPTLSQKLVLLFVDKNGNFKRQNLDITSLEKGKLKKVTPTTDYDGYYLANGTAIKPYVTYPSENLTAVDPAGRYVDITINTNVELIVDFPSWIEFPVSVVPANTSNVVYKAYIKPNFGTENRTGYMTFKLKPFPDRGFQKPVTQKMDNAYPGLGEGDPIGTPKN